MKRQLLLCVVFLCCNPFAAANELSTADSALMRGDYDSAVEILSRLSAGGDARAMVSLASLYHRGEGVQRDGDKAVDLYMQAAELGSSEAQFNLGNMYLLGENLPQDEEWALTFYRLAAKQGHVLAERNMQELYRANGITDTNVVGTEPQESAQADVETKSAPTTAFDSTNSAPPPSAVPIAVEATHNAIPESRGSALTAEDKIALESDALEPISQPAQINAERSADSEADVVMLPKPQSLDASARSNATEPAAASAEISSELAPPAAAAAHPAPEKTSVVDADLTDIVAVEPNESATQPMDEVAVRKRVDEPLDQPVAEAVDPTPILTLEAVETPVESMAQPLSTDEVEALRLAKAHGIKVELDSTTTQALGATVDDNAAQASTAAELATRYLAAEALLKRGELSAASEEFESLAAAGSADAAYALAEVAARDASGADEALRRLEVAAQLGHGQAQYELAERYMRGRGVVPDDAMAITLYRDAARNGHAQAQEKLHLIYDDAGIAMPDFRRPRAPIAVYTSPNGASDKAVAETLDEPVRSDALSDTPESDSLRAEASGVVETAQAAAAVLVQKTAEDPQRELDNAGATPAKLPERRARLATSGDLLDEVPDRRSATNVVEQDAAAETIDVSRTEQRPPQELATVAKQSEPTGVLVEKSMQVAADPVNEVEQNIVESASSRQAQSHVVAAPTPKSDEIIVQTAAVINQPRLAPSAIVEHPEALVRDASSALAINPAKPANHEVLPGSLMSRAPRPSASTAPVVLADAALTSRVAANDVSNTEMPLVALELPALIDDASSVAVAEAAPDAVLPVEDISEDVDENSPAAPSTISVPLPSPSSAVATGTAVAGAAVVSSAVAPEKSGSFLTRLKGIFSGPEESVDARDVVETSTPITNEPTGPNGSIEVVTPESEATSPRNSTTMSLGDSANEPSQPELVRKAEAELNSAVVALDSPSEIAALQEPPTASVALSTRGQAAESTKDEALEQGVEASTNTLALDDETEYFALVDDAMSDESTNNMSTLASPSIAASAENSLDSSLPTYTLEQGKQALANSEFATAAKIFSALADEGDAQAQAHIGYMYYIGEGVGVDLEVAIEWYRRAAVQGNRDAQYNLAVAYAFGEGVAQSDSDAVVWYRRAAEQGSAIAQYSLGVSYALGEGVERDDTQAMKWYRAAAEQGYAAAQYNLGYGYRTGHGVEVDETQALSWFAAAAENGHASAQYSLGYMYRSGKGVTRDLDAAIKWYRLAAAQGHPDARADLASLNPGG